MKKFLLLLCTLLASVGVGNLWASVTMPTLTTDPANPVYYTIKNFRSAKYATYAGPSTQLTQIAEANMYSLWYFVENGTGVSIVPAIDPTVKLATNASATADGAVWYLVENPYNAGYFCVSLTSDATANCWDDAGSQTKVGYWRPAAGDFQGTSWILEASETTYSAVINYRRSLISPYLEALPEVLRPSAKMTAFTSAATDAELRAAVADFSANVTFKCRSDKYLVLGSSAASIDASPSDNDKIIQLISVGDGSFYLKGFMSMRYMADVAVSTAIQTEESANTPFYIQAVGDYAAARPTKWANTGWSNGYHYIHNGGSGCVGWESGNNTSQFTIETVELPSGICGVTYNVELNDEVVATTTVRQVIGAASAVPSSLERDYTTYAYSAATIPDAATATITATATVSGLPFTVSTNYEDATWYYMQLHTSWNNYVSTDENDILWKSGSSSSDAYYWAFMGNPIEGFKVINRAAGASKYLSATKDSTTMTTTATGWIVKRKDDTQFGLYDAVRTYANGQGKRVKYWGSFDAGSTFWVTAVTADELSFVDDIKKLESYEYGNNLGQYAFTGAYAGYHGSEATVISGLKSAGYSSDNLTIAEGLLTATAINQPTGKFIRIYSPADNRYWGVSAESGYTATVSDIANSGIFYVNNISSENHILNYPLGQYVAGNAGALRAAIGNNGAAITFSESATKGKYYINNGGYLVSWYNDGNSYHVNRFSTLSEGNKPYGTWKIEEVTSLPVTISAAGYATLCAPVALTIPTGVTAYTGAINGSYLTLTALEGNIPANTPVILEGAAGSYNFDITTTEAFEGTNALQGTIAAIAVEAESILTLQNIGEIGLYSYSGTTLAGFKAYLNKPAGVKSMTIRFIEDGVEEVKTVAEKKVVYNLAGLRLNKPQKGVNIIDGKAVIVQ